MKRSTLAASSLLGLLVAVVSSRALAQDATPAGANAGTTPAANVPAVNGQLKQGFALEPHLYTQLVSFSGGLAGTLTAPLVSGGLFAGYKIDRVVFGLGFEFTSYDSGGAQIVMRWAPGVRVAILRSSDERVELFGQFDFSIGHDFGSASGNELVGADLAPGIRYWVHPQFAFSAIGGWNGNWYLYDGAGPTVVHGVIAGIQALAVF